MKKKRTVILFAVLSMTLIACAKEEPDFKSKAQEDESETEVLSEKEAKDIVEANLEELEDVLFDHYNDKLFQVVQEGITDAEEDTPEIEEIVDTYTKRFSKLVTEDSAEDMTRAFLSDFYFSMEPVTLMSNGIEARFELEDQTENTFEASFITLAKDYPPSEGGTYTLTYERANGDWLLDDYSFTSAEEEALHITFEEIKESRKNTFDSLQARKPEEKMERPVIKEKEKITHEEEDYLITKEDDLYIARSVKDSSFNEEIMEEYNGEDAVTDSY